MLFPHFKLQNIILDMFGIPAGTHDLHRLIPKVLDPALHIGRVLAGIMADADILAEHPGRDFRPQFLSGVCRRSKRAKFPIHPRRMPCPVSEFMQGCRVILVSSVKTAFGREMDFISSRTVKVSIRLIVPDDRSGSVQDGFRLFMGIPCVFKFLLFKRGKTFNLCPVENLRKANNRPFQTHSFFFRLSVPTQNRFSVFIPFIFFTGELVKDDSC